MVPACDLCPGAESGRARPEATRAYRDDLGFLYRVCDLHYDSVTVGLERSFRRRTQRRTAVAARPRFARPSRRWWDRPKEGPSATGQEQRRAREAVGWSLRQLARELGHSYSQLQSAETGRRPVAPEVAAWVRGVLDGAPSRAAEQQIREAMGDVFVTKAEEEVQR